MSVQTMQSSCHLLVVLHVIKVVMILETVPGCHFPTYLSD